MQQNREMLVLNGWCLMISLQTLVMNKKKKCHHTQTNIIFVNNYDHNNYCCSYFLSNKYPPSILFKESFFLAPLGRHLLTLDKHEKAKKITIYYFHFGGPPKLLQEHLRALAKYMTKHLYSLIRIIFCTLKWWMRRQV